MTPEQFAYWLQGYMEIADPKSLDEKQLQVIKDHLNLLFKKETPIRHETKHVTVSSSDKLPSDLRTIFDLSQTKVC